MSEEPVLERAGALLLELLRENLVPSVLHEGDAIRITWPNSEEDYRVGVFLYDIEEARPYGTPAPVRMSDTQRRGASRVFALHFLVYANRKVSFDGMTALDEMTLVEAVMRAVHNAPSGALEGEPVTIRFDGLTCQEKVALWQSMSTPLQPAVYLVMEPFVVPSTRLERLIPVREVQVQSRKKEVQRPL